MKLAEYKSCIQVLWAKSVANVYRNLVGEPFTPSDKVTWATCLICWFGYTCDVFSTYGICTDGLFDIFLQISKASVTDILTSASDTRSAILSYWRDGSWVSPHMQRPIRRLAKGVGWKDPITGIDKPGFESEVVLYSILSYPLRVRLSGPETVIQEELTRPPCSADTTHLNQIAQFLLGGTAHQIYRANCSIGFGNGAFRRVDCFTSSRDPVERIRSCSLTPALYTGLKRGWLRNPGILDMSSLRLADDFQIAIWTSVPKSWNKRRPIAIESPSAMLVQQGVKNGLYTMFANDPVWKRHVFLHDSTLNQQAALHAAERHLSTIDLSAASDSVDYRLLEGIVQNTFLEEIIPFSRTRSIVYEGQLVPITAYATMGNASTFPMEVLVFSCIAWEGMVRAGVRPLDSEWYVYGDDIIVPERAYYSVTQCLRHYGFTVNTEKSYVNSRFYESCGLESLDGRDITPRRFPRSLEWKKGKDARVTFVKSCNAQASESDRFEAIAWARASFTLCPALQVAHTFHAQRQYTTADVGRRYVDLLPSRWYDDDSTSLHLLERWFSLADRPRIESIQVTPPTKFMVGVPKAFENR